MPDDRTSPLELWEVLERSKDYRAMEKLTRKILQEQWNDALYSGVVNTLFGQYKNYFVNRRGKKITIRKADEDEEIRSIQDLRDQERETQQQDRFIVDTDVLNMKALMAFMAIQIAKSMKNFSSYYSIKRELRKYLRSIMNSGGQDIIDDFVGENVIKFRLSNSFYIKRITERVNNLVKGLDETTKKRFLRELVKGIKLGETKSQLMKRMTKIGKDISRSRAKMIIKTETQAALEFMRYETARVNGVKIKKWRTARDERVCPVCRPLDGKIIGIDTKYSSFPRGEDKFGFEGEHPPAHPNCNCSIEYALEENLCINLVNKTATLEGKIAFLKKAIYSSNKDILTQSCVNPNALWAGGNSLVGKDKQIGNYYQELKTVTGAPRKERLSELQNSLTQEGYIQLRLKLGLSISNIN